MKHSGVKNGQRHISVDKRAGYGSRGKGFGSEGNCAEHRLRRGWESVFCHIHLSLKHLNYLRGKNEFSIAAANLFHFFLITVSKQP